MKNKIAAEKTNEKSGEFIQKMNLSLTATRLKKFGSVSEFIPEKGLKPYSRKA